MHVNIEPAILRNRQTDRLRLRLNLFSVITMWQKMLQVTEISRLVFIGPGVTILLYS